MNRDIRRALQLQNYTERKAQSLTNGLKVYYNRLNRNLQKEIILLYEKYGNDGILNISETNQNLTEQELELFKSELEEIQNFANSTTNIAYQNEINRMRNRVRVTRYEEFEVYVKYEIEKVSNEAYNALAIGLAGIYAYSYYRTLFNIETKIGFGTDFKIINNEDINKVINRKWINNENYKDRLKVNKDRLYRNVTRTVGQDIASSQTAKTVNYNVANNITTGYNNTVRLARTEFEKISGDGVFDGYRQSSVVERYQFLATLDDRTTDICADLDLEIFDLSDKKIGINYPPLHSNCRSTTVDYFEPDEIDALFAQKQRASRDEYGRGYVLVDANLNYKDWYEMRVGR